MWCSICCCCAASLGLDMDQVVRAKLADSERRFSR